LQRRKTRTRRPELGAALLAALCLAGCGGGSGHRTAPQPKLPRAVAAPLASQSDEVARTLDAGDACAALERAQKLQQDTVAAINAGRVPGSFQEQLASTVGDLVSRIECVPPAKPQDRGKHEGRGKDKHKQQNEGDQ
jgi:hypothetical protein